MWICKIANSRVRLYLGQLPVNIGITYYTLAKRSASKCSVESMSAGRSPRSETDPENVGGLSKNWRNISWFHGIADISRSKHFHNPVPPPLAHLTAHYTRILPRSNCYNIQVRELTLLFHVALLGLSLRPIKCLGLWVSFQKASIQHVVVKWSSQDAASSLALPSVMLRSLRTMHAVISLYYNVVFSNLKTPYRPDHQPAIWRQSPCPERYRP